MEEFTSIAIWILIVFLVLSASAFWFSSSETFQNNGLGVQGLEPATQFGVNNTNSLDANFFGTDCSTVSATDLAFGPCFLARGFILFDQAMGTLWNLLTGWVNLINLIIPSWIPGSDLFKSILIPLLGAIQFFCIFVIVLRVAGIIRGGS